MKNSISPATDYVNGAIAAEYQITTARHRKHEDKARIVLCSLGGVQNEHKNEVKSAHPRLIVHPVALRKVGSPTKAPRVIRREKQQFLRYESRKSENAKNYLKTFRVTTKCRIAKEKNEHFVSKYSSFGGASGRTRTYNPSVNSRMLCH